MDITTKSGKKVRLVGISLLGKGSCLNRLHYKSFETAPQCISINRADSP
jgi:hypothetical protein